MMNSSIKITANNEYKINKINKIHCKIKKQKQVNQKTFQRLKLYQIKHFLLINKNKLDNKLNFFLIR